MKPEKQPETANQFDVLDEQEFSRKYLAGQPVTSTDDDGTIPHAVHVEPGEKELAPKTEIVMETPPWFQDDMEQKARQH